MNQPDLDTPARLTKALADRYRIERPLGAGGMATVYLAEDLKHSRRVAIKVLKPELAAVLGAERFLTEIKTTANLQHPHILGLFDSGEADSYLYYVMPFIDGESLLDRLERERQLPVEEAVRIARDVADALDYAHRHGVIHRDIKPANILLHDGRPLVADFGIALAISAAGGGRLTETGLSLGTPHYMSPEQASAERDLSARSDVYSLGCVLYEMLAGEPPHTGPNAASILMRILTEQPRPISELRPTVPLHVASAVGKAVEKLPADRFESAKEFRQALEDEGFRFTRTTAAAAVPPAHLAAVTASGRGWDLRSKVLAGVAAVLAIVATLLAIPRAEPATAPADVVSFQLLDSIGSGFLPIAGPGGWMGWITDGDVWVREPGSLRETVVAREAANPAFSPNGEWVAYAQQGQAGATAIRKVPSRGGNPVTLATITSFLAIPNWGDDGWIYLMAGTPPTLFVARIPQDGGAVDTVFATGSDFPLLVVKIPGHPRVVISMVGSSGADRRLVALNLDTRDTATVLSGAYGPSWSPTGHLLFTRAEGSLFAVPFDPKGMRTTGAPVAVLDSLAEAFPFRRLALSPDGSILYALGRSSGLVSGNFSLRLMGLTGSDETIPLPPSDHWDARFSPDGQRLAYIRNEHVWVYDLDLGTHKQLTHEDGDHHNPVWSPDGRRVAFTVGADVFVAPADGSGQAERVGGTPHFDYPAQWLPDSTILTSTLAPNGYDIYLITLGGTARPILEADWGERGGAVSPDGRWLAFSSLESGTPHLYVRRWPSLAGKVQVSEGNAGLDVNSFPLWSRDGRTLYYHQGDRIVAATVDGTGDEARITSRRVVRTGMRGVVQDLHPDGRRLLVLDEAANMDSAQASAPGRLIVTTNWLSLLRQRMSGGARP